MASFENLSWAPIDQRAIEPSLLSADECEWVDAYHRRVLEIVAPQVEVDVRQWLERATAPLPDAAN